MIRAIGVQYSIRRKIELSHPQLQHVQSTCKTKMDGPDPKRRKKSDKAKEKFDLNGGFSQKHVRMREAMMEERANTSVMQPKSAKHKK